MLLSMFHFYRRLPPLRFERAAPQAALLLLRRAHECAASVSLLEPCCLDLAAARFCRQERQGLPVGEHFYFCGIAFLPIAQLWAASLLAQIPTWPMQLARLGGRSRSRLSRCSNYLLVCGFRLRCHHPCAIAPKISFEIAIG